MRALLDNNNEDVPTIQKMQMVYYAMGFTTFTVNVLSVFENGGAVIPVVINKLIALNCRYAQGKPYFKLISLSRRKN